MEIAAETKPPATITRKCSPGSTFKASSNKPLHMGTTGCYKEVQVQELHTYFSL